MAKKCGVDKPGLAINSSIGDGDMAYPSTH